MNLLQRKRILEDARRRDSYQNGENNTSEQKNSNNSTLELHSQEKTGTSTALTKPSLDLVASLRKFERVSEHGKRKSSRKRRNSSNTSKDLIDVCFHDDDGLLTEEEKIRFARNQVPFILGTQQMRFKLKTGLTTLINGSPTLNQVVAMDISGVASWSSWANLFDEYRIHKATLVLLPIQCYIPNAAATGTVNVGIPAGFVVDYDDATAIGSTSALMQYDTMRPIWLGRSDEKIFKIKAYPEGQPDLAWVTTATPTVPFWFKCYQLLNPPANSMALAQIYLEVDVEFRQVA